MDGGSEFLVIKNVDLSTGLEIDRNEKIKKIVIRDCSTRSKSSVHVNINSNPYIQEIYIDLYYGRFDINLNDNPNLKRIVVNLGFVENSTITINNNALLEETFVQLDIEI